MQDSQGDLVASGWTLKPGQSWTSPSQVEIDLRALILDKIAETEGVGKEDGSQAVSERSWKWVLRREVIVDALTGGARRWTA